MNKYEIARRLNISHQAVYKWFNGKSTPSVKNLALLAKILGLSMEETIKELRKGVL